MALIVTEASLASLRKDPRILKLPPYLSAILVLIGVGWLLVLPTNEYSRGTYISENALLPGQVHTYFGGSEHNVFRAYRHEVNALNERPDTERYDGLEGILRADGLKAAQQEWRYERAGQVKTGKNVYAVLQGPRADATEAMVLIAAWRNQDGEVNYSGVALVLTLARYFKRWSLWSKDIIILIPSDSTFGPQAWVDAYHDTHDPSTVESLSIKSGALQGAIAIDYPAGPWGKRFEKLHVVYDGVNGQLPNLDLINTAMQIARGQMGISCTIQRMWSHGDTYKERVLTMLRGMISQAVGHGSGPHSSFMPYHVDAITLQTVGEGWHDEMSLGRAVEGTFRSLNNLLEHLHQSFFFYLLMHPHRFVSIGTYLPSAMLIAGNFTVTAMLLWILSGRPSMKKVTTSHLKTKGEKKPMSVVKEGSSIALVPTEDLEVSERELFIPLACVSAAHALGLLPLYALNQVTEQPSLPYTLTLAFFSTVLPLILIWVVSFTVNVSRQHIALVQCFSLLLLGATLSTLATVNFAQALFVGLFASPLSFVRPLSLPSSMPVATKTILILLATAAMLVVSPLPLLYASSYYMKESFHGLLVAAAWGWRVEQVWTGITVWIVWWPAWVCGTGVLLSGLSSKAVTY